MIDTALSANILFVVHNFPPHWFAGVEIYTYSLAKELIAKGCRVSVLYPKKSLTDRKPFLKKEIYDGIRVFIMHYYEIDDLEKQISNKEVEDIFKDLLDRERFDIVHFHHLKGLPLTLLDIAKTHSLSVLTLHDFWLICLRMHLYNSGTNDLCDGPSSIDKCVKCISIVLNQKKAPVIKKKIHHLISYRQEYVRGLLERVDVVSSPSRYLAKKFSLFGFAANKINVFPLGLNTVHKLEKENRGDKICFGYIGSIQALKNTIFLAEAFKSVRGKARLIFWGNGHADFIAKLNERIKNDERMEYKGNYSPDELPYILSQVDVVIVPSIIENYPCVVREALSAVVPVIASNVGGIPEIISHMKNGILFESNNKEELAKRIGEIIDNPSIIEKLKKGIEPLKTLKEDAIEWLDRYSHYFNGRGQSNIYDRSDKRHGSNNISLVETKNGRVSIQVYGKNGRVQTLHSLYDPEAEARAIADAFHFSGRGILVVLGLGAGYHVAELVRRFPDAVIIAVESEAEIYKVARMNEAVSDTYDKVKVMVGIHADEVLKEITRVQIKTGMAPISFFTFTPALVIYPEYYNPLLSALQTITSIKLWDRLRYPKFKAEMLTVALIDFGYFLTKEVEKAIKGLGHNVINVRIKKNDNGNVIVSRLINNIIEFKPDFLFTINHLGFDENGEITSFLNSIEMPLASWYVDSPNLIVRAYDKNVSPHVSIFLWDKEYINDMRDTGFESVNYLPLAADMEVFKPVKLRSQDLKKIGADIGFVGNSMIEPTAERLKKISIEIHGIAESLAQHISSSHTFFDEAIKILNNHERDKIDVLSIQERLNLEAAVLWRSTLLYRLSCIEKLKEFRPRIHGDKGWHELLNGDFSIMSPLNYYRELPIFYNACKINFNTTSLQMLTAVNQRVFDVPACGAFLLTDDQDALGELFDRGKEVITYKNREEIPDLLKFYLNNPPERKRIAEGGRERILREHTYAHRIKRLIDCMKKRYT